MILEFINWLKNIKYTPKGHIPDDTHLLHIQAHQQILEVMNSAETKRSQRRGISQKHNKTSKGRNKKTKAKSKAARKSRA